LVDLSIPVEVDLFLTGGGTKTGRTPGISVWNDDLASPSDALWYRKRPAQEKWRSFEVEVGQARTIAIEYQRKIDVVADPLDFPAKDARVPRLSAQLKQHLEKAGGGHSLLEGIKRPDKIPKKGHRLFLSSLSLMFSEKPAA